MRSLLGLFFFVLFMSTVSAGRKHNCRDSTLECLDEEGLYSFAQELQAKYKHTKSQLAETNCTICNVVEEPCYNGGTCIAQDDLNWICNCPDDYTGQRCETLLTCEPHSCGPNAECKVFNHRVNCICKFGYSGDPYNTTGCLNKTVSSCMSGDPHYRTFDGNYFDYQGTCPYIVSKNCESIQPYGDFEIKARNVLVGSGLLAGHVSAVSEVQVETSGLSIHIGPNNILYVNGTIKNYAYFYPDATSPEVSVTNNFGTITIARRDGLIVTFQWGSLCVFIPDVPELQGVNKLCGLAGNRDNNCTDDLIMQNGTLIYDETNPASCSHNLYWMPSEYFGDSWIIPKSDWLDVIGNYYCEPGHVIANTTNNCTGSQRQAANTACQPILDSINGTGIFNACQPLGVNDLQHYYENCGFDICGDLGLLCGTLAEFVKICQETVPFANVGDWRDEVNPHCPAYNCPPDSTYNPCASRCQQTCQPSNGTYGDGCIDTCTEGCNCDPGYVEDTTSKVFKCIRIEECGCTDDNGNTYPANSHWLNDNCTKSFTCQNGTIDEVPNACSVDGYCVLDSGVMQCTCNSGYMGDGYNCTDIDECEDPQVCNQVYGWGTCTNTPGSYYCNCSFAHQGNHCQIYMPKRHCADWMIYNNQTTSGVYTIYPTNDHNTNTTAYCDMDLSGGGWTFVGNSANNVTANKSWVEYEVGFGDPSQQYGWLGLKWLNYLTNISIQMSLHLELTQCNGNVPYASNCTYPLFKVYGADRKYQVQIPPGCNGTANPDPRTDGWVTWNSTVGPRFYTYDSDDTYNCSNHFMNTGWWYDTSSLLSYGCGKANLNGLPESCTNPVNKRYI